MRPCRTSAFKHFNAIRSLPIIGPFDKLGVVFTTENINPFWVELRKDCITDLGQNAIPKLCGIRDIFLVRDGSVESGLVFSSLFKCMYNAIATGEKKPFNIIPCKSSSKSIVVVFQQFSVSISFFYIQIEGVSNLMLY